MFGSISDGDRVIATKRIRGGLLGFGPEVRRGSHGIVRGETHGFFTRRATVEFDGGHSIEVATTDVRRAMRGHGQAAWEKRQATRRGVKIGLALLWLPVLVAALEYFLAGGTPAGMIAAAPMMIVDAGVKLVELGLSLGVGPVVAVLAVGVVLHRRRGHS